MPTSEQYLGRFVKEDNRHITRVRTLRRQALADDQLDPIAREVIGLTGSSEELLKYHEIARKVGACAGEPIVRIETIEAGRVKRTSGGFITGELCVVGSSFSSRKDIGRASGHAMLAVPVRALTLVARYNSESGEPVRVYSGDEVKGDEVIAAHIINHEWENCTPDPSVDYYDKLPLDNLLIGTRDIYHSPYFSMGLNDALLEIEKVDRQHQAATV